MYIHHYPNHTMNAAKADNVNYAFTHALCEFIVVSEGYVNVQTKNLSPLIHCKTPNS